MLRALTAAENGACAIESAAAVSLDNEAAAGDGSRLVGDGEHPLLAHSDRAG